jgi:hypothetical protein
MENVLKIIFFLFEVLDEFFFMLKSWKRLFTVIEFHKAKIVFSIFSQVHIGLTPQIIKFFIQKNNDHTFLQALADIYWF